MILYVYYMYTINQWLLSDYCIIMYPLSYTILCVWIICVFPFILVYLCLLHNYIMDGTCVAESYCLSTDEWIWKPMEIGWCLSRVQQFNLTVWPFDCRCKLQFWCSRLFAGNSRWEFRRETVFGRRSACFCSRGLWWNHKCWVSAQAPSTTCTRTRLLIGILSPRTFCLWPRCVGRWDDGDAGDAGDAGIPDITRHHQSVTV